MPIVNKTTLKSYFQTDDIPTESNFVDFIDTIFNGFSEMPKFLMLQVSQIGVSNPTTSESINQIGGFNINYISTGTYTMNFNQVIGDARNIYLSIIPNNDELNANYTIKLTDNYTITITTRDAESGSLINDVLANTPVCIMVVAPQ